MTAQHPVLPRFVLDRRTAAGPAPLRAADVITRQCRTFTDELVPASSSRSARSPK